MGYYPASFQEEEKFALHEFLPAINTLFLLKEQFYKNKSLELGKKIKNKLRIKPGLLSYRS